MPYSHRYSQRLGYISYKALKYSLKHSMIWGIQIDYIGEKMTCYVCIKAKITCKAAPKESGKCAKKLGEKVYSDVWGPPRHLTIDKRLYYVSFTDDYSRESVNYLMGSKDQVFLKYKLYKPMMLWQWDVCVQTLVSNYGGKYTSKEFENYSTLKGSRHKLMVHNTPEKNGVAEWLNCTLVKRTRDMLLESNLLKSLWGYGILHANYIKNWMYTHSSPDKTPFKMVHGKKHNLHNAYEWGKDLYIKCCTHYTHIYTLAPGITE